MSRDLTGFWLVPLSQVLSRLLALPVQDNLPCAKQANAKTGTLVSMDR